MEQTTHNGICEFPHLTDGGGLKPLEGLVAALERIQAVNQAMLEHYYALWQHISGNGPGYPREAERRVLSAIKGIEKAIAGTGRSLVKIQQQRRKERGL